MWSSGRSQGFVITSRAMRWSQSNILQPPPGSKCSSAEARPQPPIPLFSSNLRGSNHRAAGGQGCEEARGTRDRTPPPNGNTLKHKCRPPAGERASRHLPCQPCVPFRAQFTAVWFQKVHTQKSLFFSTIFSFPQKQASKR